ncbi:hypothetical protein M433DRAFT_3186 [Acidomyces richmondensis BFW]|nr:hypothetical protein M433DRAFT_3186 [Acidomyces richmondensis BFW]
MFNSEEVFTVENAGPSDLESLSTMVARSFHPVNPYIKSVFPDTPLIRQWFSSAFADEMNKPAICRVLKAFGSNNTSKTIGILCLRLMEREERSSRLYSLNNTTEDHNREAYDPMINSMRDTANG